MFRMKPPVAALAVVVLVAVPVLAASPAGAAAGGNSANAHLCQKGGWQTVETNTGGSFANQDACVSYGAKGGTIYAPKVVLTHASCVTSFIGQMTTGDMTVSGTGFHPASNLSLTNPPPFFLQAGSVGSTDAGGAWSGNFSTGQLVADEAHSSVTLNVTLTDSQGVHASATTTVTCRNVNT